MHRACASSGWPRVSASDIEFGTVLAAARVQGAALAFDATLVAEVTWSVSAAVENMDPEDLTCFGVAEQTAGTGVRHLQQVNLYVSGDGWGGE